MDISDFKSLIGEAAFQPITCPVCQTDEVQETYPHKREDTSSALDEMATWSEDNGIEASRHVRVVSFRCQNDHIFEFNYLVAGGRAGFWVTRHEMARMA